MVRIELDRIPRQWIRFGGCRMDPRTIDDAVEKDFSSQSIVLYARRRVRKECRRCKDVVKSLRVLVGNEVGIRVDTEVEFDAV